MSDSFHDAPVGKKQKAPGHSLAQVRAAFMRALLSGPMSTGRIRAATGLCDSAVHRARRSLMADGLVELLGHGADRVYRRTDSGVTITSSGSPVHMVTVRQ